MSELTEYVALEVDGEKISLYDALLSAKLRGELEFVEMAIEAAFIRQAAEHHQIDVTDEELQLAADNFRAAQDLYDVEVFEKWLAERSLSFEDWESLIEASVLRQKVSEAITAGKIEQHFAENRLTYDAAEISRLVVPDEDMARELLVQITDENADFHSLARSYSVDPATRLAGGYAGILNRVDMEAAVEAAIFGAHLGKVVGPFKLEDGWHLIKIESVHRAELDDALRETIKAQIFKDWLDERWQRSEIKAPLLKMAPASDAIEDLNVVNK
jgi:putative peptide maturation system protein